MGWAWLCGHGWRFEKSELVTSDSGLSKNVSWTGLRKFHSAIIVVRHRDSAPFRALAQSARAFCVSGARSGDPAEEREQMLSRKNIEELEQGHGLLTNEWRSKSQLHDLRAPIRNGVRAAETLLRQLRSLKLAEIRIRQGRSTPEAWRQAQWPVS